MTSTNLPSDYEECISVTALAVNGQPLSWCDYNSAKDICVPGELLYSTSNTGSNGYEFMSGTSMAAPVCSGVLALMWAANPSLTVAEAKAALYETAAPLTVPAGREGLYGHGVLDASAAVAQACGYASAPMADPYVSTGIGSGKIRTAPYGSWYKRSGVQMLYTASELGNKANIITGLAFNVIAPASFTSTDVKVYLGHTSKNVFGSAADAVSADNLTLVYSGALTVGQERGWEELKLDKSFAYNGTDNLVVAVFHSSATYNGSLYYTCSTKPGMILSRGNDSSSEFVSVDYLGNYVVNSERPDLRLHVLLPGEELDAPLFTEVAAPTGAMLPYNGFEQIGVSEGEGYTLSGVTSATAAGTYEAVATLRSTYIWEDGSQDPRVIRWSIQAPEVRDTEVQVGTQIGSDYHAPYCNYYRFSGSQTIYTADEIGKAGSIDSLAFFVTNATAYSTYSVRVYLGHTKKAAFESGSEALAESDLTLVYAGTPTLGQAVGWERLNFDTAFNYNGTDNLAVVVYHISTEFTSALRYAKTEGVCLTRQSDTVESYAKVEDGSNYSVKDGRPLALLNMGPLVETDPGDGVEPGDGDGVGNPDSGNQDGSGSANPPVVTTPGGGQTQPGDSGDATPDEGGSVQVQVGVQTSSTFDVPYAGFFCYGASQSIYTASEIGRAGLIESLGFLVTVASPLTTTEVKVYLGHTRKDGFTSANAPLSLADVSLVYTGHPTLGQSTGWEEMTLDEPFAYNGVDNLAVVVCRASDDWNGELQYGACAGSCIYRFDDGDDSILNMANSDSYSLDTSQRPMISLAMTDLPEDAFGQNVPGDLSVVEYGIGLQLVVFEPTVPLASGCPVWHGSNMWWNGREQCWMLVAAEESGLAALEAGVSLNATGDQRTFALPGSAVAGQVVGDLNGSGSMSIVDAQLCYNIACGSFGSLDLGVNQSTFLMADVNGDHYVDAADALALQHAIHCGW